MKLERMRPLFLPCFFLSSILSLLADTNAISYPAKKPINISVTPIQIRIQSSVMGENYNKIVNRETSVVSRYPPRPSLNRWGTPPCCARRGNHSLRFNYFNLFNKVYSRLTSHHKRFLQPQVPCKNRARYRYINMRNRLCEIYPKRHCARLHCELREAICGLFFRSH